MADTPFSETDLAADEELVAYLDGELNADEQIRIERRLADDSEFRARLVELQKAWDLLDTLHQTDVDDDFTRTTVEMVAQRAADDSELAQHRVRRRRLLAGSLGGAAILASALLGYWLITERLDAPNQQLVRDLPVIEHVHEYRNAESIDFLRQLSQNGLFVEEVDDGM